MPNWKFILVNVCLLYCTLISWFPSQCNLAVVCFNLAIVNSLGTTDTLQWWRNNINQFPILVWMASGFLAVPFSSGDMGTSSALPAIFVTIARAILPETIEALITQSLGCVVIALHWAVSLDLLRMNTTRRPKSKGQTSQTLASPLSWNLNVLSIPSPAASTEQWANDLVA